MIGSLFHTGLNIDCRSLWRVEFTWKKLTVIVENDLRVGRVESMNEHINIYSDQ